MSKSEEAKKDYTYFHERLDPIGWTEALNVVHLPAVNTGNNVAMEYPLFDADEDGNLVIPYYRVNGQKADYKRGEEKWGKEYKVLRRKVPIVRTDGSVEKYKHPSGTGTLPWFPPQVIDAYNEGKSIQTLVLTEGVLKAFAGAVAGAMMVGLPGIHNVKDKQTGTLHADVVALLKKCKPEHVVFLHDGDCRAFSTGWPEDASVDLYKRPNSFYTSARNLGELLKDYARMVGFRTYYMHVVSESIKVPAGMEPPKGLDDLLLTYQETKVLSEAHRPSKDAELLLPAPERRIELRALAVKEVIEDLTNVSVPPRFFERRDLDRPDKLRDYFHLRSADSFYAAHQERIGEKEFVYDGTKYQWSEEDKELKVKVPSIAKRYVRVGTDYYKYIKIRNPHSKQLEEILKPWRRPTIVEDHGKTFCEHILKLEAFVNYPDHVAYKEIVDNCLNSYSRFMHTPDEDADAPVATLKFLEHIFGSGTVSAPHPKRTNADGTPHLIQVKELDLGLDYLKLLYEQPTQMLPIFCAVSKMRGTGKTTFFDYLQTVFGNNCTFIGAKDLEGDFNFHYASKKIVIIDEALIGKQESVEKLKSLSTAKYLMVNNKGVAQYQQACFLVFLLGSNNIRNFIKTDDDEVRFWVRNIPQIKAEDNDTELATKLVDEVPAFLHYLRQRPMATEKLFRSWFHPPLLVTDALLEVRKHSVPTAKRTITGWVRGMFWARRDMDTIMMTATRVREEMFKGQSRVDEAYIRQVLKEEMNVHPYRNAKGEAATTMYSYWRLVEKSRSEGGGEVFDLWKSEAPSRPFVFHRRDFITEEEEKSVLSEASAPATNGGVPVPAMAGDDDDLPF